MSVFLLILRDDKNANVSEACAGGGAARARRRALSTLAGALPSPRDAYPLSTLSLRQEHNRDYLFSELGADDGAADAGAAPMAE